MTIEELKPCDGHTFTFTFIHQNRLVTSSGLFAYEYNKSSRGRDKFFLLNNDPAINGDAAQHMHGYAYSWRIKPECGKINFLSYERTPVILKIGNRTLYTHKVFNDLFTIYMYMETRL